LIWINKLSAFSKKAKFSTGAEQHNGFLFSVDFVLVIASTLQPLLRGAILPAVQ
jgi:hypothetical protein